MSKIQHPSPTRGLIACRRTSSSPNQEAHSGRTGSPNRWAMRYNTKTGLSSHRTVRLPSGSAPGLVCAISAEIATKWRMGLRPAILMVPRKHCAPSPSVAALAPTVFRRDAGISTMERGGFHWAVSVTCAGTSYEDIFPSTILPSKRWMVRTACRAKRGS